MFRRALSTAVFCLFVFGATLAVQGIWSALLVANLQTTPALPWSVPVMAALLWALWSYAGGRAHAGGPRALPARRTAAARDLHPGARRWDAGSRRARAALDDRLRAHLRAGRCARGPRGISAPHRDRRGDDGVSGRRAR